MVDDCGTDERGTPVALTGRRAALGRHSRRHVPPERHRHRREPRAGDQHCHRPAYRRGRAGVRDHLNLPDSLTGISPPERPAEVGPPTSADSFDPRGHQDHRVLEESTGCMRGLREALRNGNRSPGECAHSARRSSACPSQATSSRSGRSWGQAGRPTAARYRR